VWPARSHLEGRRSQGNTFGGIVATILIHMNGFAKPAEVEATVYGAWAVHAEIGDATRGAWTVTHVRTGMAVRRGIRGKRRAQAVARALQAAYPDAFNDLAFGQKPSPDSAALVRACQLCIEQALAEASC
jgi:hypothetical protein